MNLAQIYYDYNNIDQIMRASVGKTQKNIVDTIDELMSHHYFAQKLEEVLNQKNLSNRFGGAEGLLDDEYYREQGEIIEEINMSMEEIISKNVRNIINTEYININEEISAIKQEMYTFTEQQHKITDNLKKQVFRLSDEVRRKSMVSSISGISSTHAPISTNTGIRFVRNAQKQSQLINLAENNDKKSYHSQIISIKKQIQDLKASIQNMQAVKLIRDQFNDYKLETKIVIESLNQKFKKITEQDSRQRRPSSGKQSSGSDNIKQYIDASVKRSLKALSSVYGSYSEQVLNIKQKNQALQQEIEKVKEENIEYLSKQLKSVWMVLNDLKRSVDSIVQRNNLDMSMQIL